jgi:hypothetical protein
MATSPYSRRLNLTRDQLAQFLTDQQQIRQFELLFSVVDELQVITGTDFEYQADTAAATANEALAQIAALAQDTAVDDAVLNAKVQQVLDAIPRLAQVLNLLALAPVQQNNNSVTTDYIDFNTNPPTPTVKIGRTYWDGGTTLGIQMTANVLQQVGESQYYYIKADSTITKGQLIMFTGAVGASGVIRGAPATGLTDGQYLIGIAAENIASNGFGLVASFGHVRGWNTTGSPVGETWVDGDILYYNPTIPGALTKTQPTAPNVKATIAVVINAAPAGSGEVFVRVATGSVLGGTDSNVQFGTLLNGDLIQYDSLLQYWKNVPVSTVIPASVKSNLVLTWLSM